jgi:hypothetical protein
VLRSAVKNTADVTGGKPIAVLLQSISVVSAVNPLVAFYDIHFDDRHFCILQQICYNGFDLEFHICVRDTQITGLEINDYTRYFKLPD